MNTFQVIQPSVLLAPYVRQYWFLSMENPVSSFQRLVPFGCTALSFYRGCRAFSLFEDDYLPVAHLHGIATNYTDIELSGTIDFICVVFQPAGAKAVFRMPLHELNNGYASPDALNDRELGELAQRLNETADNLQCTGLIEQFLFRRIYQLDRYEDRRINTAVASMYGGERNVGRLAGTACLSYKQFKRVFAESVGANPKEFLQIVRFQQLHRMLQLRVEASVSQLAHECGYYDKSHLIRELKSFSGFTPTGLSDACDPVYSGYHALFRSAFVDLPSPPIDENNINSDKNGIEQKH